jgi:hypothetical protein
MVVRSAENWKLIIDFTEKSKSETIKSLRIPLYMIVAGSINLSLKSRIGLFLRTVQMFLGFNSRTFCSVAKERILFCIPYGTPSNISNLVPIVEEASKQRVLGGILLGRIGKKTESDFRKYPCVSFQHMVAMVPIRIRIRSILEIFRTMVKIRKLSGQTFPQLKHALKGKWSFVVNQLSISMLIQYPFEKILRSWHPSSIITTSDFWPFEYQLIHVSKRIKIPTFIVQHGIIANEYWWPFYADSLLLWGKTFEEQMIAFGAPKERLCVLGMPSSDNIFKNQLAFEENLSNRDVTSCLIISQTNAAGIYPEVFQKYYSILKEAIIGLPKFEWRIKLHPVEDDKFYIKLGKEVGKELRILPKSTTLESAVKNSDIAIIIFSTAGLEVMIMQRPLIVLDLSPRLTKFAWWPSKGGGIYASDSTQLQSIILRLLNDKDVERQQIIRQNEFISNCFENPGHSSKAILEHVLSKTI